MSPAFDNASTTAAIRHFHDVVVGPFWPIERGHVDSRYRDIDFPFPRLEPPALRSPGRMGRHRFLGYLRTWSAVRRSTAANGADPVDRFTPQLRALWGAGVRTVTWPLTILAGRLDD